MGLVDKNVVARACFCEDGVMSRFLFLQSRRFEHLFVNLPDGWLFPGVLLRHVACVLRGIELRLLVQLPVIGMGFQPLPKHDDCFRVHYVPLTLDMPRSQLRRNASCASVWK